MLGREVAHLAGGFRRLELLVAGADGGLVETFTRLEVRTYSVMSSRSSMNLASAAIRPMSCSRLIVALPGFLAEKSAISFMM